VKKKVTRLRETSLKITRLIDVQTRRCLPEARSIDSRQEQIGQKPIPPEFALTLISTPTKNRSKPGKITRLRPSGAEYQRRCELPKQLDELFPGNFQVGVSGGPDSAAVPSPPRTYSG
jgi:hypothetical protein